MFTNILVPLDGSAFSEQAVAYAVGAARRANATLHFVRVHGSTPPRRAETPWLVDPVVEAELRQEEHNYIERVAELPRASGIRVRTAVVDGPVVVALAGYIEDTLIDLVVMTTHGRGGLSRIWLGSVADSLIRSVETPVLLMRPRTTTETAYGKSFAVDKIVIPLDGTEESERMLEHALEFGSLTGARYSLVQVVAPPVEPSPTPLVSAATAGANEDFIQLRQQATDALDRIAAQLRARGLIVDTSVVLQFQAAAGILEHSVETGADLIAMATHGRTGWPRIMLGSVADKVLRGSSVPLLLLPPEHKATSTAERLAS